MVCYYNDETTNSTLNMEVYCLFETVGDGDGYRRDNLRGVFTSCQTAIIEILSSVDQYTESWRIIEMEEMTDEEMKHYYTKNKYPLVHRTMNKENNYIYIGKRCDCCEELDYREFGGYIIEPITVDLYIPEK